MVEISSPDELEEWLKGKPKEWAQLLACRSVLRVVPVFNKVIEQAIISHYLKNQLKLSVLRVALISEVSIKTPNLKYKDVILSSMEAASRAADTVRLSVDAAHAAKTAAHTARTVYAYENTSYSHDLSAYTVRATDSAFKAVPGAATHTALMKDIHWLMSNGNEKNSQKLLEMPLWHDYQHSLLHSWAELRPYLLKTDHNWNFWVEWYQSKLDGTRHIGLSKSKEHDLYSLIASFPNDLWEKGAEAVNRRIAELMANYNKGQGKRLVINDGLINRDFIESDEHIEDFFLSYSTKDEAIAKKITQIIQQEGHSVFAQFNDMPVGSNFITEMQEGLENSSKFISLYSENYWSSDYCQQEWNAAITYDPRGKKRKIIPFLIRECAIPPLARPLVYKNLIGLNNEEFQRAIREAIENDGVITSEQARKIAKKTISPEPYFNDDQELDIRANEAYDQQRVTEDLYNLPDEQITLIDNLLGRVKGRNTVPQEIVFGFEQYRNELVKSGVQPNISLLNNLFKLIELDIETSEFDEWKNKQTEFLIEQLGENHTKIQSHFPLDMVREENYRDAPMEVEKFNEDSFYKQIQSLNKIFKELKQEQLATDRFLENRQYEYEQIQQLLNLDATRIIKSDETAVIQSEKEMNFDDFKKRRLIQAASFADKLAEVLEKSDKIIKNPSAKYLSKLAKNLADWLWS